jgi:hypothetical protein
VAVYRFGYQEGTMSEVNAPKTISARALLLPILSCAILFGATPTYAALWGWSAVVKAKHDTNRYILTVSGATHPDCESKREAKLNQWQGFGYRIISEGTCGPIFISVGLDLEDLMPPRAKLPPWPWPGPVCLSCPILSDENIRVLFPNDPGRVQSLIKKYDIDSYNSELLNLQKKFDLEGFERELYLIDNERLLKN